MVPAHYALVTLPNGSANDDATTLRTLTEVVWSSAAGEIAKPHPLAVPKLLVGTLDSLMSLSDELGKVDTSVEATVRKIERQYTDVSGVNSEPLTIGSAPAQRFLEGFQWDIAKYPNRNPLADIVGSILDDVQTVEDELKDWTMNLPEKNQQLAALNRKKSGNLSVAPLDEVLTAEVIETNRVEFLDTEYLKTLVVIVPRSLQQEWERGHFTIGLDIAGYGGPRWDMTPEKCGGASQEFGPGCDRHKRTGSPVVPGSTKKVLQEGEHLLYTVVVLKGQYEAGYMEDGVFQQGNFVDFVEPFKAAAREQRFIVRDFTFDPEATTDVKGQAELLEAQVQTNTAGLVRWCRTHFGEAVNAWIHIKVIRAFVESVLRYGLPPNFVLVALKVNRGKEKQLGQALDRMLGVDAAAMVPDEGEEGEDYHPYVRFDFSLN